MLSVSWGVFCLCHGVRTGECVVSQLGSFLSVRTGQCVVSLLGSFLSVSWCEDWGVCCQSVGELPVSVMV